jgi:predicted transcriptional regulator
MIPKLTEELSAAVASNDNGSLEVVNPHDNRTYFIVEGSVHQQAMDALRRQQDHDAIAEGIAQMEAGEGKPLNDAFEDIRVRLQLPKQA